MLIISSNNIELKSLIKNRVSNKQILLSRLFSQHWPDDIAVHSIYFAMLRPTDKSVRDMYDK
jgi:hypothetical protein